MPVEVIIDEERKLGLTICTGLVTDEEFLRARDEALASPQFDPSRDRLWDFSGVTAQEVSEGTIAELVKTSPFVGDILRAVVVNMSPKLFGPVLDFVAYSRQFNRRIAAFPTREAALEWIDGERRPRS
ncbi:MAG: hypothetical protein ABIR29_08865 [Chthoniobacterales bacterium]